MNLITLSRIISVIFFSEIQH